jgi:hypothetical protein
LMIDGQIAEVRLDEIREHIKMLHEKLLTIWHSLQLSCLMATFFNDFILHQLDFEPKQTVLLVAILNNLIKIS